MILVLVACVETVEDLDSAVTDSEPDSDTDADADADGDSDSDTDSPYAGVLLEPPLAPPEFSVENQDRESRDADWLAGHGTVLWFFRNAGSS